MNALVRLTDLLAGDQLVPAAAALVALRDQVLAELVGDDRQPLAPYIVAATDALLRLRADVDAGRPRDNSAQLVRITLDAVSIAARRVDSGVSE